LGKETPTSPSKYQKKEGHQTTTGPLNSHQRKGEKGVKGKRKAASEKGPQLPASMRAQDIVGKGESRSILKGFSGVISVTEKSGVGKKPVRYPLKSIANAGQKSMK